MQDWMQSKLERGSERVWCPQRRRSKVLARVIAASFWVWVRVGGSLEEDEEVVVVVVVDLLPLVGRV